MLFSPEDEQWMGQALTLARKALGQTRPNPVVGAVVVKEGRLVARGYHRAAGLPHAEAIALKRAEAQARGATLYVTLEPCCHFGRTPPCVEAVVRSGVKRVVIPILDPNPLVSGQGAARLREAGIRVDVGCRTHEAIHANEPYITFHKLKRPFFVAKWAVTLDGQFGAISGDSRWISNELSRAYVHELRARYDAVLVGIGTVISDNPRLNVRLPKRPHVIQPKRIIIDGHLRTPIRANCLALADGGPTIIATTEVAPHWRIQQFESLGITIVVVRGAKGVLDLKNLTKYLYELGIQSVLVEGGRQVLSSMFAANLVDRVVAFFAPKVVGSDLSNVITGWGVNTMRNAIKLHDVEIRTFGTDVCVEGYVHHFVRQFGLQKDPKSRKEERRNGFSDSA
jgi:diaminohydroxyphosphoribosylaminopyrimidine deaminase/5-amino-6-(5-phosphoribosylamino)uracil reductase